MLIENHRWLSRQVQIVAGDLQAQRGVVLPAHSGGLAVGVGLVYYLNDTVKAFKVCWHLGA